MQTHEELLRNFDKAQLEFQRASHAVTWYLRKRRDLEIWAMNNEKPPFGWTPEKHQKYHAERIEELNAALDAIQTELLRINPD